MTSTTTEATQGHSRRSIVAGLLAMLPATAAASTAAPAPANPDAELIALAKQIADLKIRSGAAFAERDRRFEIYKSLAPELPPKLIWHTCDPVGWSRDENGKYFCNLVDVERLRGRTSFREWHFIGTAEEREKLSIPNRRKNDGSLPVVGYDHLFVSFGDEFRLKRAQELLAALDEYNAAEEAADVTSGWSAADEAYYAIEEQIDELIDRMSELKPTTLEGYQALESVRAA